MKNIITYYAYPRSGATLFSKLVSSHPSIFVTPEMISEYKAVSNILWTDIIHGINQKFRSSFDETTKWVDIELFLVKNHFFVVFRVWLLGVFVNNSFYFENYFHAKHRIILNRNFLEILGSLGQFSKRDLAYRIPYGITIYEKMLDLKLDDTIFINYECLINKPKEEIQKLNQILCYNDFQFNLSILKSNNALLLTGDSKLNKTSQIGRQSNYYKFQFNSVLYSFIKNKLSLREEINETTLSNPSDIKTLFKAYFYHYFYRLLKTQYSKLLKRK